MSISRKIYILFAKNLSVFNMHFIIFVCKEALKNILIKNFPLTNIKKKQQILFDNFETIEHFAYRYVVLKAISCLFKLKIRYFNLGKNFIYFFTYSSLGARNITLFFFKIRNRISIKKLFFKEFIKIKSKKDLFNYKLKGVNIGWDIYESYLKRFNKATLDIHDKNLFNLFYEALLLFFFWEDYLKKNKVKYILTSHRMYIETNILNRLAIKRKIPIITIAGDGSGLMKFSNSKLSIHRYYKKLFDTLDKKEKKNSLIISKKQLSFRLSGKAGVNMSYSTKSAYSSNAKASKYKFSKNKTNVLICTHCFYDNPHPYGKNMFIDFYEWLLFLANLSYKTDYNWYIKPHPDYLPGTIETILEISKKFKKIKILDPKTKFNEISNGIDFALTTNGSVGHELPLLGITVINADYNNPHCAYKFNYTPKNINDYRKKILNLNDKAKITINKNEIYQFYYMHYYYMNSALFSSLRKKAQQHKDVSLLKFTQEMYLAGKFNKDINNIKNFFHSANSKFFNEDKKAKDFTKICNI